MTGKANKLILWIISCVSLFTMSLFCYLWVYMPYIYEQDVEKVKAFQLENGETVQQRIMNFKKVKTIKWTSGEFFPCATVEFNNNQAVTLCFVIKNSVLYAKNDQTTKSFPKIEKTNTTMH